MQTFKFVLWLLTILVLPIAATTGALWGLLLYLLKNTELLKAQRQRPESEAYSRAQEDEKSLRGQISFSTLPRAFASDVELIAASKDGQTVVSVGLHNEIFVWNSQTKKHIAINAADVLLCMAGTSTSVASTITALTVDDAGRHFAVGTGAGLIAVWSVNQACATVNLLPLLSLENSSPMVAEMRFVPPIPQYSDSNRENQKPGRVPPVSEPSSQENAIQNDATPVLLATYEGGLATRWTTGEFPTVAFFSSSRLAAVVRASLMQVTPGDRVLIAFSLDDGSLDLIETGEFEPTMLNDCLLQPGNSFDMVSKVHACRAVLNGSMRVVVAAATEAGSVSLWDGLTGECINVLEEGHGQIRNIRVSPVQCETCHFCGQLPLESLAIAFSTDDVVQFFRLYLDDQTRRCSCSRSHHQLRRTASRESLGRRSRSNSNASSSQKGSPLIPRARLATAFENSAFPVSGHGVHSRRASEKDTTRRSFELLTVPFPSNLAGDESDFGYDLSTGSTYRADLSGSTTPGNPSAQPIWRNAVLVPLSDIVSERGGWDVADNKFIGIRRKPRSRGKSKIPVVPATLCTSSPSGLTSATLERWELWTFDPAIVSLRSSLLSMLSRPATHTKPPSSSSSPSHSNSSSLPSRTNSSSSLSSSNLAGESITRLPFTRVSPVLIAPSHVLAGFGNTIGVFHFNP